MKSNSTLMERGQIDNRFKWKLEDLFASDEAWEQAYAKGRDIIPQLAGYKGKLGDGDKELLGCISLSDRIGLIIEKVFVYARMRRDEDNSNTKYQQMTDRAMNLITKYQSQASFITPEIISISREKVVGFMEKSSELSGYMQFFEEIWREKDHILSDEAENLLALSGEMADAAHNIFTMFDNADIRFPNIHNEEGEEVELTKGRYSIYLRSRNREVRKAAFKGLYKTYEKMKNSLGAMYIGSLKKDIFYSAARKYPSSLEAALYGDNVPLEVYDRLISEINKNLPLLHKFMEIKRDALKLDELHLYDVYVPVVESTEREIPYSEALEIVTAALEPLGPEYVKILKESFESGWIDVYENRGKTGGAYSWGAYPEHPYVLLNYQGKIQDIFTLAHEMGHAMHSWYTNKTQPYIYSQYKIFVAEVASTVNEALLMQYLLKNVKDNREKAYLLEHYLEGFRTTVFRQVMFAEFEKIVHQRMENGEALSADRLGEIYYELNIKYFGAKVSIDNDIKMEWARIPHFYRAFYVYKYATGYCSAASISKSIIEEGLPAVERYMEFLKSGSSDYPLELLKNAGVDLVTPKPVQDTMALFDSLLGQFKAYF